jgi:hypothetical protein
MQTIRAVTNLSLNDMKGEIWKDVLGYEKQYQISNFGRVKSLRRIVRTQKFYTTERIMKVIIGGSNVYVNLLKNKVSTTHYMKHLVAFHFLEKPDNSKEVVHINGDYLNNRFDNLKYI